MTGTKEPPAAARLPACQPTPAFRSRRFPVLRPLQIAPDADNKASYYYTDDHVRALISDIAQSTAGSRRRAARKLRMLAKHSPENRLRIAAAGAVAALVSTLQLLQSSTDEHEHEQDNNHHCPSADAELQEHTITAIYNLSLHDSNLPLIAASGAVSAAVSTLGCPEATPDARSGAACLLLRLARHDGDGSRNMLDDIGRSLAIPLLVDLLRTGELRGQKDAATALYALTSRWAPNRARAAQAGLVPALLELIEDPGSCMVEKAAYILSVMVEDGEARAQVAECGGVAIVVGMVEMGCTRMQREIGVNVLVRMCGCGDNDGGGGWEEDYQTVAVAEGAIPALLAVAQPESGCSARSRRKAKALLEILRQTPGAGAGGGGDGE